MRKLQGQQLRREAIGIFMQMQFKKKFLLGIIKNKSDHTERKRLESHGSVASHNHTQHFEEVYSRRGVDFCSNEALESQYLKAVC